MMRTVTKIIVPTTGGARGAQVLEVADELAGIYGLPILVNSWVDEEPELALRRSEMDRITAPLTAPVTIEVEMSDDPGAAVEAAADEGIVCMATSAKLTRHDGHFGSYAERALRTARQPLVLLGPSVTRGVRGTSRIVVPVDGSAASESAIQVAADLGDRSGAKLWVVTVVSEQQRHSAIAAGVTIESGYVRRLAKPVRGEFEVLHGDDTARRIVDFASSDGLVVMSSHGKSGLARLAAGSVTMAVVAEAAAPVLVIPPRFGPPEGGA
ncbi:MAG: universal stress protein [Acidimicrobiia bacterium]|nr:universal stress protein [Acidimicrobiia bacterium]